MDTINLKLNFAVDLKNMVAEMAGLVNKGLLSPILSVVSPAADTAVQKVGQIAGDLIDAFMGGPNQKEDLVHFDGSFDKKYPLPTGKETFEFDGQRLLIDKLPADQYSWVAQWQEQLDALLAKIQTQSRNRFSTAKERRALYAECIKGARGRRSAAAGGPLLHRP